MTELLALIRKDLTVEIRTKETLASLLLLGLLTLLILSFAFDPTSELRPEAAPGALWVAVTFAGILGLGRSFLTERENDCLMGLLLSPIDRGSIYLAKATSNFLLMTTAQIGILPVFVLFFDVAATPALFGVLAAVLLGMLGLAALGSLFAAIAVRTRAREVMLPLLMLPLIVPLFIAGVSVTEKLLAGAAVATVQPWLGSMLAIDIIFLVAGWLLFDLAVEE
jgi:heme exporter protein B